MSSSVIFLNKDNDSYFFSYKNNILILSLPSAGICRFRAYSGEPHDSIMVKLGYVKGKLTKSDSILFDYEEIYEISGSELKISLHKDGSGIIISNLSGTEIFKMMDLSGINPGYRSYITVAKTDSERFHGFGFQRKTLDANGHRLTFKKEYRWDEATVPYFLSSDGYGFFSANTYNHTFDFRKEHDYTIDMNGGDIDFFIMYGPGFKKIIQSYTGLTGRPHMVPAYALGLCYVGRLFETQEGILGIARRFREEGIPCDMIGLEPGWEKHYYQMKWVWNNEMFPHPEAMINELHDMDYVFELWESGDAPTSGYMNPENRREWFSQRVPTSLDIGVDFYKQDDPYPRCITSEEMVTDPSVDILIDDEESRNVANTLYSTTVFDEMRKITGKRAFIIFHAYCSTISSQMYPCVWAGDFGLGNGALNASLSGHAMVTQDMRNEIPSGIHFGFLLPFTFMDSWAYYLEPWLHSDHIKEMIRFYSRLRTSLFPYLYSALWQSHTTGLPILRPMQLEFQYDPKAIECESQYMLGDSLLVGLNSERNTSIYLPEGNWFNYWSRELIESTGAEHACTWPPYAGGPLFVKSGAIIPMMNSTDSIIQNKLDFLMIDIYPKGKAKFELYEDDGITYLYEKGEYEIINLGYSETDGNILIHNNISGKKAVLFRLYMASPPVEVGLYKESSSFESLLTTTETGWYYDGNSKSLYIKGKGWKFENVPDDLITFYGHSPVFIDGYEPDILEINIHKSSNPTYVTGQTTTFDENPDLTGCKLHAVINPPERVRLNHGDDWLPYYIYVGYEIIDSHGNVVPVNTEVTLKMSSNDVRDIEKSHKSLSFEGVGHFDKIIVSPPTEPPDINITLAAEGIIPITISYKV